MLKYITQLFSKNKNPENSTLKQPFNNTTNNAFITNKKTVNKTVLKSVMSEEEKKNIITTIKDQGKRSFIKR